MATDITTRRILDAALALFNERGVGAVSTRAIAERAGVSSGNLHYHYTNKEAVVRALLARRDVLSDPIWVFPDTGRSLDGLERMLRRNLQLAWEYRFLNRELVTFTLGDPAFRAYYAGMHRGRIDQLRTILASLVDAGVLHLDSAALDGALTAGWILSENWLVHLETIGVEVTDEQIAVGARLVMSILDHRFAEIRPAVG